jgi:hypothetical protein
MELRRRIERGMFLPSQGNRRLDAKSIRETIGCRVAVRALCNEPVFRR